MKYALLLSLLLPFTAHAKTWQIDYSNSSLGFTAVQNEKPFEGSFRSFTVEVNLDPAAPEKGTLLASVNLGTVAAGTRERTQALPQREWFDIANHPHASFRSESMTKKADGSYEATGQLTLKGISQTVTIPFTLTPEGEKMRAIGSFTLDRSVFKVGIGEWESEQWIKYPVVVKFNLLAS